ncbi:carbohydrate-binding family 9-like protein [Myxococcota bacterium]|nr:carbohydrate-binding family 9-like protein [Myxococcota bacterium]
MKFLLLLGCVLPLLGCKITKLTSSEPEVPSLMVPSSPRQSQTDQTPSITLDGLLTEPQWEQSARTTPFVHPGSGDQIPGNFGGSARLFWDSTWLYIAFEVRDPSPTSPFLPEAEDPHIWSRASGVEIMIQPGDFADNKHYFEVQVDMKGSLWDTHFSDYNQPRTKKRGLTLFGHQSWDSHTKRAVKLTAAGYTLEMAIPWSALSFKKPPDRAINLPPKSKDIWRLNLYVFRDAQRLSRAWSPLLGKGNFHRTSRFGRVSFR